MPLKVCDYQPCESFQRALEKLIVVPNGTTAFNVVVISKEMPLKTYYLPIHYCPFCGTRIEEEWIETFLRTPEPKRANKWLSQFRSRQAPSQ